MKKRQSSIDGFVPRRSGEQLGDLHRKTPAQAAQSIAKRQLHTGDRLEHSLRKEDATRLSRAEISASLRDIDQPLDEKKLTRRQRRKAGKRPITRRRRIIKWVIIGLLVLLLAVAGFVGFKALFNGGKIFKGNIFDAFVQNVPLKQDANGRTNILIFGTSEDDPGHSAAYLTDSIIVLSVDQNKKEARMFNLPRDLEVKYGTACMPGYSGKINVVYGCHYEDGKNEPAGAAALQKAVGEVTGLDVQYYAHVNYTVVRQAVEAVGGITITIESRDPRGQMDANFDWKCGAGDYKVSRAERIRRCPPSGHFIDYPNGPVELDAEHALYLAQARGEGVNYGLEMSNFDREKNQQKIIEGLRVKAMSAGTLANVGKVTSLMDALGDNLRTNFEAKELSTLISLAKDIPAGSVKSISLVDEGDAVLGGDAQPLAGKFDYTDIHTFLAKQLSSNPVTQEAAEIAVFNGSETGGVAQRQADKLSGQGFVISDVGNAPDGKYDKVSVYQIGTGNPATAAKLKEVYGVEIKTTPVPFQVASGAKFVVIFGVDPDTASR